MAAGPIKRARHKVEYWLTLLAAALVRAMSERFFRAFAESLGAAAYVIGVARRRALANLRMAFPEKTEKERRAIARRAYRLFAVSVLEVGRMPSMRTEELVTHFDFKGLEILDSMYARGKGLVGLSAHYGSWELMGAALVKRGYPTCFAMGTQSNPYVDELFMRYRKGVGIEGVRIGNIRALIRALKENKMIAIVQDQDGDKWGVFTRFFGQDASTYAIADLLARKTGCALAFGVPRRLDGLKHEMTIHEIPEAPPELNQAQATAWRMQYFNNLLEEAIRADPGQWLWMHHRWEAKPHHRLQGEDRRRAEAGEIWFDTRAQQWKTSQGGEVVDVPYWK